jgi:hypothetical protein
LATSWLGDAQISWAVAYNSLLLAVQLRMVLFSIYMTVKSFFLFHEAKQSLLAVAKTRDILMSELEQDGFATFKEFGVLDKKNERKLFFTVQ